MLPRLTASALVVAVWASTAQAWHSSAPAYPPPPSPSCDQVTALHGDRQVWVGNFAGRYRTGSPDGSAPYGAVGCFLAEAECRQWLQQNMSFAGFPVYIMSCRPAAGRAVR